MTSVAWPLISATLLLVAADPREAVHQSARQVPVAYQVDVLVVGGSTGAVSAAVEAAEAGAKVFLAAPHPYLGDDITATLRLWLEPGETPTSELARAIFGEAHREGMEPDPARLNYQYQSSAPSGKIHADTDPPSLLCDGVWGKSNRDSVQYEQEPTILADLGQTQRVGKVRIMAYQRTSGKGGTNFKVDRIAVATSTDQKTWQAAPEVVNPDQESGSSQDACVQIQVPVNQPARWVKLVFTKAPGSARILLGEIEIVGTETAADRALVRPVRPMHVKKVLDEALLAARVSYLYGCYPTEIVRDATGRVCGMVMANRAGRQAVLAKTIIDATDRATVARLAGGEFRPYPAGEHVFRRVVIGGEPRLIERASARVIDPPFRGQHPNPAGTTSGLFKIIEYTLRLSMPDSQLASFARADQVARTLTYHPEQQFTSDQLFEIPPDAMRGKVSADGPWQGVEQLPLGAFQPAAVPEIYVLGGCADISRPQAEKLLRPLALMDAGTRIGKAAAEAAAALPAAQGARVPGAKVVAATASDVQEVLVGVRPTQKLPTIPQEAGPLPVLGRYDVVVIGGGTSGAPAGIGAARRGARTLVVEYLHGLGGVGTIGAISKYCAGNRVGFTATVQDPSTLTRSGWVIEQKSQWWREELLKAGADLWYGVIGCGALVDQGRVTGAVIATPHGRGVVLAKVVIDATGNADVAAAAGADCIYTNETEVAMQGTGLPGKKLGGSYNNTDFTITDETDLVDVWHLLVYSKHKYPEAFDHGRLVDTRERRCVVGDYVMTFLDQVCLRTHPDTICQARAGAYDTHGYTVDPLLTIAHPKTGGIIISLPFRSFLAKGLEGLLVTGLGVSCHRDANPLIRMQPDLQNAGYACGVAAAQAAKSDQPLRQIDLRPVQEHLVQIGNLQPSVLTDRDNFPLPEEKLVEAVAKLPGNVSAAAPLFTQPQKALPLLREAYARADDSAKLDYALVLAMLGDAAGVQTILDSVRQTSEWDAGWNYKGLGQFGNSLSPLDGKIVALGCARDRRAVPVILDKMRLLTPESEFSHFRAVTLALEMLADPAAAQPLAEMLARPGIAGYVHATIDDAIRLDAPGGTSACQSRRDSLRELGLARALCRCGDHQGQGQRVLQAYAQDLRGHLARHAAAVLQKK